jgi:hypothetical protein
MRRIDHLHIGRSPTPGQFAKQVLPQPPTRPAHEAVIDGCRRAIFRRAIAPAASALENMHDPADDPAIVYPLDTAHVPRQIPLNSSPPLVAQPKQILAHDPDPLPKTNQDRILRAQKLMSFDPSHHHFPSTQSTGVIADSRILNRVAIDCKSRIEFLLLLSNTSRSEFCRERRRAMSCAPSRARRQCAIITCAPAQLGDIRRDPPRLVL